MRKKVGKIVQAQQEYAQIQDKLYLLDRFYPQSPEIASGVSQLIGLAVENGLAVDSVSVAELSFPLEKGKKDKEGGGLRFSASFRGRYENILRFLSQLNNLSRWVQLNNYSVSAQEKEEGKREITVNISGYLRFFVAN